MSAGLVVGTAGPELLPAEREMLAHPAVAGVILFSRNYQSGQQLRALCEEIRALKTPRLLIAVDQEGGRVQRFRTGFTALPPLQVIGRWYRTHPDRARDLAYRHGRVMAAEVLGHGVDISLAPVLDLARGSSVIGDRAFSEDPGGVLDLAGYYIAGMRDAGMKNCAKHFPGHGSVEADSHLEVVTDPRPMAEIEDDLKPYRMLAGQIDAVMPAHVVYPEIDNQPAGFSTIWLGMLRELTGFDGVVISDDLDMAGAGGAGDVLARWQAASEAGCDLALVCRPDSALGLVERLPDDGVDGPAAMRAAARLHGRASFTLAEQDLVPEFRAWKSSLKQLAGESID